MHSFEELDSKKVKKNKQSRAYQTWTDEELDYLIDNYGSFSIPGLAKKLNRSIDSIINKRNELDLGPFLEASGYMTLHVLYKALGISTGDSYRYTAWVENRDLPVVGKRVKDSVYQVIRIDHFWKWAYKNRSYLDFSNFKRYALGAEPDWVDKKKIT